MKHDDILWGVGDQGDCLDECMGDVIGEYLSQHYVSIEEVPEEITVFEYRRVKVSESDKRIAKEYALDAILDHFEEIYGSDAYEPTLCADEMKKHLDEAIEAYVPWRCETTGKQEKINTREWIKENDPYLFAEE
jgi:hypothetical protein